MPLRVGQPRSSPSTAKPRLTPPPTAGNLDALRILFISDSASPHTGGLNRMVVETCSWLGKAGHDVALAYHDEHPSLVDCPVFHVRAALPMAERRAALEKAVSTFQPDVLYCHSIQVMPSLPGLSERFPLASFYHDQSIFCSGGDRCSRDWSPCHRPHGWSCLLWHHVIGCGGKHPINNWRRWRSIDSRMLAWRLPRSRVQVASRFMQRGLEENGFPTNRLDLVPLCAEPPPADASIATESGLLLVPGRMVKSKGIDLAIRAFAQLQDLPCRLVVAGDGPQRTALEQLARELGVTPRVTFTGEILPTALASWYARASVILFPVLRPEPFGLIGVEALAYGKPIVAFDGGAVDEWLWPGETGAKVQERTPEAFASAIRELIRDPQRCTAMGQAAKRRHAFFHPDAFVQRLTDALDRTIRWHRDTAPSPGR
jgi:glycosyltransferase involved in cell wall biosynthesis